MIRSLALTFSSLLLVAGLAMAEPSVQVRYIDGVPQISITGDYPRTRYTILRAAEEQGPFAPMTAQDILCLGSCYGDDFRATPGATYWYRFDLTREDNTQVSFGPYRVTISATLARATGAQVFPNPIASAGRIELFLAGHPSDGPLPVEALLFDLQGRRVRSFWRGPLTRGLTSVAWDGRDDAGRSLGPGAYFLRLSSPHGVRVTRVLRAR
jgi:hypothetical protein